LAVRAAAQSTQIDDHRDQQPQEIDAGRLLSSQAYTIVVSGRK
jgi:hypothetical protein